MAGMKVGSGHKWTYKTTNYKRLPKGRFEQTQSKGRTSPAPYGSGMPTKSNLLWNIKGNFTVKKIGRRKYLRITTGLKSQGAFKLPTMKKMRYTKPQRRKRKSTKARFKGRY